MTHLLIVATSAKKHCSSCGSGPFRVFQVLFVLTFGNGIRSASLSEPRDENYYFSIFSRKGVETYFSSLIHCDHLPIPSTPTPPHTHSDIGDSDNGDSDNGDSSYTGESGREPNFSLCKHRSLKVPSRNKMGHEVLVVHLKTGATHGM
jgi:hypothetical protein